MGIKKYIFDVDGTLTPSRGLIDPDFLTFMIEFAKTHYVAFITGSDYDKTVEQIGPELCEAVDIVYNCCGNSRWINSKLIYENEWEMPKDVRKFLAGFMATSAWGLFMGAHFDIRPGLVNFSIVGRGANSYVRRQYVEFDQRTQQRHKIAAEFNAKYPELEASVGGETGLDIFPRGLDKSQIIEYLKDDEVFFYGDRMEEGGNDHSLAKALDFQNCFHVADWQETFVLLSKVDS